MSDFSVLNRIMEILVQMGFDEEEVKPEASLVDDLGMDSTERVEVTVALQKEFGVRITRRDLDGLGTPTNIAARVEQDKAAKAL